jgi:hydroxyethylthiazole kinase-like uncharacterized protein yjeF
MGVALYTAEQVSNLDRLAKTEFAVDGYDLMVQAGEAAFSSVISQWPAVKQLIILCGGGNNGGDGLVVARLAKQHHIEVQIVMPVDMVNLSGEARQAADDVLASGLTILNPDQADWPLSLEGSAASCEVIIVDALFGSGLSGEVTPPYESLINQANNSGLPILAIDVPSGLNATTGVVGSCAILAHVTLTMIDYKQGLFTGDGPAHCGDVRLARLNLPDQVRKLEASSSRLESWLELSQLPRFQARAIDNHKGYYGHVLVVGGDLGCGGAISLAAGAALRSGAGLVSVATRPEHVTGVLSRFPEAMVHGVKSGQDLQMLLDKADAIVVGPGLGQSYWGEQLLQQVMAVHTPVMLDADALNILAKGRIKHNLAERISVMTPHPGEASRLLGLGNSHLQARTNLNRFDVVKDLVSLYSSSVVLKGVGSLICTQLEQNTNDTAGHLISICNDGNAGMASGGMGDVLSGIVGSLMAQSLNAKNEELSFREESSFSSALHELVTAAVCMHSAAADVAATQGQAGLLASDVVNGIRGLLK